MGRSRYLVELPNHQLDIGICATFFFFAAISTYLLHAALRDTDNQFKQPYRMGKFRIGSFVFHSAVWLLIIGEIGGFTVLFIGAVHALFIGSE